METKSRLSERAAALLGICVALSWTLILGPIGALALGGLACSMFLQSLALGITCGLIFFSPLLATLVWAPLMWQSRMSRISPSVSSPERNSITMMSQCSDAYD